VDPTNRSLKYARNRVRLNVIPELAKINPRATEAITRLAEAAAALGGEEERAVADALASATRGDAIAVDALADDELRGQVLALAWTLATARTLSARHRGALERLTATTDGTRSIDLPGGRAVREYGMLRIATTRADVPQDEARRLEPGREITWNGWRLALGVSGTIDGAQEARIPGNLMRTLEVRSRRPGDRLPGPRGRKLQDVFTDAKVPLALRRRWPVISTAEGVWWVPGLSEAPPDSDGTPLAVTAPGHFGNVRWSGRVRQVASKREPTAKRSRRGPSS
jgi:tRNA(Ile)-lysidine synthase